MQKLLIVFISLAFFIPVVSAQVLVDDSQAVDQTILPSDLGTQVTDWLGNVQEQITTDQLEKTDLFLEHAQDKLDAVEEVAPTTDSGSVNQLQNQFQSEVNNALNMEQSAPSSTDASSIQIKDDVSTGITDDATEIKGIATNQANQESDNTIAQSDVDNKITSISQPVTAEVTQVNNDVTNSFGESASSLSSSIGTVSKSDVASAEQSMSSSSASSGSTSSGGDSSGSSQSIIIPYASAQFPTTLQFPLPTIPPTSPFYRAMVVLENIQESTVFNTNYKSKLLFQHANERLNDINYVISLNNPKLTAQVKSLYDIKLKQITALSKFTPNTPNGINIKGFIDTVVRNQADKVSYISSTLKQKAQQLAGTPAGKSYGKISDDLTKKYSIASDKASKSISKAIAFTRNIVTVKQGIKH